MNRSLLSALVTALLLSPVPSSAYQPILVTNGGNIRGVVRLTGEVPKLPAQPVYKHAETCGAEIRDERLIVGANGALENAVVTLIDVKSGKQPPLDQPIVLDNQKCAFVPHVVAASEGQQLVLRNSDPILHDAHATIGGRTLFNRGLPKGSSSIHGLTDVGLVEVNCNVRHTWMRAYLYVSDNPYHAVTDPAGAFAITDIPPGTYTVRVWHELLGSIDREVKVEAGKTTELDVSMEGTAAVPD